MGRLELKGRAVIEDDLEHILQHSRAVWDDLRGQSLFITGGTGFVGTWILESIVRANESLRSKIHAVVLTRNPERFTKTFPHLAAHPSIELLKGDVRKFDFPPQKFSHILHMATESSAKLNSENPLEMFEVVTEGTRHTLDFAVHCGARKFLLTSSGAVYGKQPSEITHVAEGYFGSPDTLKPESAYGEGKRVAELLCSMYEKTHGIETKIARGFAFVGPRLPLDIHFAVGNFIRDGLRGGPIVVKGDGTPYRSYLYASDMAIWLLTILTKGKSSFPYNVGSDHDVTITDLARLVASSFGTPRSVEIKQTARNVAPERYVPSIERSRKDLGLEVSIDLSTAIKKTILYHCQ